MSSSSMITLKAKLIASANFRGGGVRHFSEYAASANLKGNECVILVSKGKKIVRFVFPEHNVTGEVGSHTVISHRDYHIVDKGTWSMMILQNCAHEVGIKLEGIKLFEQYFGEMQERKRKGTKD